MSQTMSVTDINDNFPTLVYQISEQEDPVVITSHNQPRAVLVPWALYQQQQTLQTEGAEYRLQKLIQKMTRLVATLQEIYQPDSYELIQGTQELLTLAHQAWKACRLLEMPRRHLASTITDGLLSWLQIENVITMKQLAQLLQSLPLLQKADLTLQEVADSDLALAAVGLDAMISVGDELVSLYE